MKIASILENQNIEKRIAITPEIAKKYISLGFELSLCENYANHLGINDLGIRYGGDEFILLLLDKSEQESLEIAEAIRSSLEQTTFLIDSRKINITASIGLASYPKHAKNSQQVLKMADEAMYNAKSKSRNRVYVAS